MSDHTHWKRWAGAVSGTALGYIGAGIPGAVAGARWGYSQGKKRDFESSNLPENSTTMATPRSVRRRLSFGTPGSRASNGSYLFTPRSRGSAGRYTGSIRSRGVRFRRSKSYRYRSRVTKRRKFKRKMKRKMRKRVKKNHGHLARVKGYEVRREEYGQIEDNHCVYVKHSTADHSLMTRAIIAAMIRKVFLKAGYQIGKIQDILTGTGFLAANIDASKYRLLFTYFDPASPAAQEYIRTLDPTTTLQDLSSWSDVQSLFYSYLADGSSVDFKTLSLQSYVSGSGASAYWVTESQIDLENEVINLYVTSSLTFQNRTKSPDNSLSTDVANNQPVKGKIFQFSGADPRLRASWLGADPNNGKVIQGIKTLWGVEAIAATNLPTVFKEPPNKDAFANCKSVKPVLLNIGETKKTVFSWNLVGRMKNAFPRMRPLRGFLTGGLPDKVYGAKGKSEMLVLEEVVRTDATQKIAIGYEREITIGCWFTTKPPVALISEFIQQGV